LVKAIHDALDFAHDKNILKSIKLQSKQAETLTLMLKDVYASCKIIQSYAEDSHLRMLSSSASLAFVNILFSVKRALKNMGGELEKKIKELSGALVERRRAFLDQAIIYTQNTASEILDELEKISTQISDAGR
jgi:hypothetical protein